MSRGAQNQATQTFNTSSALTGSSSNNANNLYNTLIPTFNSEATNPQGFTPTEKANMTTASNQSLGGGVASAVGEANSGGAAKRNSGSFAPALDEASRSATRQQSENNLGIQDKDTMLKNINRQSGISGLSGLQSQQNADILSSLGLQNQSTNALTDAGKNGWFQNMLGFMNAIPKVPSE